VRPRWRSTAASSDGSSRRPPSRSPRCLGLIRRAASAAFRAARVISRARLTRIVKAAADAGRPEPRVVVNLPVAVVDDADRARTRAAELFSAYEGVPTYQRVFERNQSPWPVDAAVIGDERTVADRIRRFGDLGATDFLATVLGLGDDPGASRDRTFALLASLL
jgi:alkanesulfonate monooxygenase SsuD/methylene tetrahydromethanopterin reductase-like flavin-dependent oxidoreductase (luciferase family)